MGLPDVEAGLLSGEAGTEEISWALRYSAQHRRSELYVSATGERNDHPELDWRNSCALSLWRESASGHHPHQATEGDRRLCAALSGYD